MSETHANYLRDLGQLLREAGQEAKRSARAATDGDRDFERVKLMAYYEVLSLMQQQAVAFDLPLDDLALDELDPNRDLI